MSVQSLTGTAMLLAIAIVGQSLRLLFPFIPNQISMFLIGTIVSACLIIATWRYSLKSGLIIAWITPIVAYMQGMLPLLPFIAIVGLGSSFYVIVATLLRYKRLSVVAIGSAVIKATVLYIGFSVLFSFISVPPQMIKAILFSMGWPQLVTGGLGILLAKTIDLRMKRP